MSQYLEEYFHVKINLKNCEKSINNYIELQIPSSHLAQFIALPFQTMSFHIILTKTPDRMKPMRLPLFLNHLFCALFDFYLCTLSCLYIFPPMMAFTGLGLLSWIGPFLYQAVVGGLAAVGKLVKCFKRLVFFVELFCIKRNYTLKFL
nr:hypothetical protein R08H2.12 - Caenorhabditis elegans [Caenorhabditis elegans]